MAKQLASVTPCLSQAVFSMWDVHSDDLLISCAEPHIPPLDIVMGPSETQSSPMQLAHWALGFALRGRS